MSVRSDLLVWYQLSIGDSYNPGLLMSLRKKLASILEKTAEVLKEDDTKERLHLALVERQNKIDERVLRLRRSLSKVISPDE